MVVDLKEGIGDLYDLLQTADVSCTVGGPALPRLGLDFQTLQPRLPNLVYCSITGFGSDGPRRDIPGHEAIVHALVGTMSQPSGQLGHRDGPIYEALPFASMGAGYLAVMGILSAIYRDSMMASVDWWRRPCSTAPWPTTRFFGARRKRANGAPRTPFCLARFVRCAEHFGAQMTSTSAYTPELRAHSVA